MMMMMILMILDTGRGLRCRKKIKVGGCLISVPKDVLITTATVIESYIGVIIRRLEYLKS